MLSSLSWSSRSTLVSEPPSIAETKDGSSWDCPFSFGIGIRDPLCIGYSNPIYPQPLGCCGHLQEYDSCQMPDQNP